MKQMNAIKAPNTSMWIKKWCDPYCLAARPQISCRDQRREQSEALSNRDARVGSKGTTTMKTLIVAAALLLTTAGAHAKTSRDATDHSGPLVLSWWCS